MGEATRRGSTNYVDKENGIIRLQPSVYSLNGGILLIWFD